LLEKEGRLLARWKIAHLESLTLFGGVHLTTPALRELLASGKTIAFLTKSGRLLGQVVPPRNSGVELRLAQYRLLNCSEKRRQLARDLVREKLLGMQDILSRYAKNYPELALKEPRQRLHEALRRLERLPDLSSLRGIEGAAAATYWRAFGLLNRSRFDFRGRKAHPARDPINSLLSLGYTLLGAEIRSILETMGFDAHVGYYHEVRANRPSLALDIMEPFRHRVIDHMILRGVNLGRFQACHFCQDPDGRFHLNLEAMKVFIDEYERALRNPAGGRNCALQHSWRDLVRDHCEKLRQDLVSDAKLCTKA